MDENKIFGMLEKIYIMVQKNTADITGIKSEVSGLKTEITGIKGQLVRMENKFDEQIRALHDFRSSQEEFNHAIVKRIDNLVITP